MDNHQAGCVDNCVLQIIYISHFLEINNDTWSNTNTNVAVKWSYHLGNKLNATRNTNIKLMIEAANSLVGITYCL